MQAGNIVEIPPVCIMTRESIAAYIQSEQERGASENALRRCKRFTASLYEWLPGDKSLTKDLLLLWRQSLKDHGYSPDTELNYVKGINRYLDHIGRSDLRFNRGRAKDIAGKQFGYLTAIAPTGEKERKDYIWLCKCKCGKEVEYPATRLLTGNTLSCGCLQAERVKAGNKYIDGTCLSLSRRERVKNPDSISGYVGVQPKGEKWQAYIEYKGIRYNLGTYWDIEDAIKARARAKEAVMEDAAQLEEIYDQIHAGETYPHREEVRAAYQVKSEQQVTDTKKIAVRSNNTSGYPGVYRKRDKWAAKITYEKVTYQLGSYRDIEGAIAARQEAEQLLTANPRQFQKKIQMIESE